MYKYVTKLLPIIVMLLAPFAQAQKLAKDPGSTYKMEVRKPNYKPVCYVGEHHSFGVPRIQNIDRSYLRTKVAPIEVDYVGFDSFPEAQAAFQFAVDIWADLVQSPVPIRILANFESLSQNVLGSAIPTLFFRNFDNTPQFGVWYPIALAEKITRRELNDPTEYDIETSFNNNIDWFFDINVPDSIIGTTKTDFASVVLHELTHGLGFLSIVSEDEFPEGSGNQIGIIGFAGSATCYTSFVETFAGVNLMDDIENGTAEMLTALTGDDLFYIGPSSNVSLHAPANFSPGSSISHLNANLTQELMLPSLGTGNYRHDPGLALNMVYDFGWEFTYILHDPLPNTEDFNQSFDIVAEVFADGGFDTTSLKLHYSTDEFALEDIIVDMDTTSNLNEYLATIPNPGAGKTFSYYIAATDTATRVFTDPGQAPGISFYQFTAAVDDSIPDITHTPIDTLLETKTKLEIIAAITDFHTGVDTAYVEFKINGVNQPSVGLTRDPDNKIVLVKPLGFTIPIYVDTLNLSGITGGDLISYRIVAIDSSQAQNKAFDPATGFHEFTVTALPEPLLEYYNDFNTVTGNFDDFIGNGFSIAQPFGFDDGAIHSIHPYEEALEVHEIFYTYQLSRPLIVQAELSAVRFEEVVLVEPGRNNAAFGEFGFWDYASVQFSKDFGESWNFIFNGYDSNNDPAWLSRWKSGEDANTGNSSSIGVKSLFKERMFDLKDHPDISAGDTILFRFLLYADELAAGWGWAIDDLQIQGEITAIEDYLSSERAFTIYPNPSNTGRYHVNAVLKKNPGNVSFTVVDILGKIIQQESIPINSLNLQHEIDISSQPPGVYMINTMLGEDRVAHKVIKTQ